MGPAIQRWFIFLRMPTVIIFNNPRGLATLMFTANRYKTMKASRFLFAIK